MSDQTSRQLERIIELLQNFEQELAEGDLRSKVKALVPAFDLLASMGKSLIPKQIAASARVRILHYFLQYSFEILNRKELMVVAGIDQWARRLRELRVEHGWSIVSGVTAKEMAVQGELTIEGVEIEAMRPDDYILVNMEQDREAAYRWRVASDIRKADGESVRDRILMFFRANVGRAVTGEELRYVARDATEWARRVRELRNEQGWPIATRNHGRPDLAIGVYLLEADRQSPVHDRRISDAVRRAVLRRDGYCCARCAWAHEIWNKVDPRHLELHHVVAHVDGGENSAENLITLCTVCHDLWHGTPAAVFDDWLKEGK